MTSPVAGVGGSRKKMGRNNNNNNKNKGVRRSSEEGSRFWMKLKLWLSCMALGGSKAEEGSTSGGNRNNKHGRKSTYGKAKDIEVDPMSSTSSSRTNRSPPPNLTINHYAHLQQFTFNELRLATRNFRPENFLGEGGFGTVFKGWVSHNGSSPSRPGVGLPVAVKTLNREGLQGHKEWVNEVNHLGALQHPNLVKLVGYCIEDEQRVLVYEFMPRGSLEHHLFRSNTRGMPLPWNIRMKIMLGVARGLAFLHEEARKPLIFRDFKTSNILLDMDFNAKLSDFGLAKDAPVGDMTHVSTRVMGTQGYAAPEYVLTGHLNSKSDVYSFGVVLLEMLTGRRAMDKKRPQKEQNLVEWVKPQMRNIGASGGAAIYNMMDPMLQGKYSARGAYKAIRLATQCCSRDQKSRPLMSEVVNVLKSLPEYKHMPYSSNNSSPSPSPPPSLHGLHVGPFSSNNSSSSSHGHGHGKNKYGLKVGSPSGSVASASSSRNTPTRFQASPLNYTPPFLSPKPRGGKN